MLRASLASVLLTACTPVDLTTVDLSDRADVIAFAVTLDDDGQPLRTTRPFRLEAGRVTVGSRAQVELIGDETRAFIVEIDHATLVAEHSDYVESRAEEIAALIESPPQQPTLTALLTRKARLPSNMSIANAPDESIASSIRAGVTLSLPVDPEHCRPTTNRFEPYGAEPRLLTTPDGTGDDFSSVVITERGIIAVAGRRLHFVEPGGMAEIVSPQTVGVVRVLGSGVDGGLAGVALDPTDESRIFATMWGEGAGTTTNVHLVQFELSAADTLGYVRTASVVEDAAPATVAISTSGRIAFGTHEEIFVEQSGGAIEAREPPDLFLDDKRIRELLWAEDDLVLSSRNRVHEYNPETEVFDSHEVFSTISTSSLNIYAMAKRTVEGQVELWGAGEEGYIFRLSDGVLDRILPVPPPSYAACAVDGGPNNMAHDVVDIALSDTHLFGALERCNAIIAMRLEDACLSLHPVNADSVALLADRYENGLRGIAIHDNRLVVVGRNGLAYTLRLE